MKPIKRIGEVREVSDNVLLDLTDYEDTIVNAQAPELDQEVFSLSVSLLEESSDIERDFEILKKMLMLNGILTGEEIEDLISTHKVMAKIIDADIDELI